MSSGPGTAYDLVPHCLLCDAVMIAIHCKYECHNCGFRIDCSDRDIEPDWRPAATAPMGPGKPQGA